MTPAHYTAIVKDLPQKLATLAGHFIVFEGPDGSGKTTQLDHFERSCIEAGLAITRVREPGGTALGEAIRTILLSTSTDALGMTAEMLLYMAARAQLVETVIHPALKRGDLVLADRFIPSTLAYQGDAGGINADEITSVGRIATAGLAPRLVVLIDVDEATAASRLGTELDRIESRGAAFHRKVRQSYLAQAQADPDHWVVIDGDGDQEAIAHNVTAAVLARLQGDNT